MKPLEDENAILVLSHAVRHWGQYHVHERVQLRSTGLRYADLGLWTLPKLSTGSDGSQNHPTGYSRGRMKTMKIEQQPPIRPSTRKLRFYRLEFRVVIVIHPIQAFITDNHMQLEFIQT